MRRLFWNDHRFFLSLQLRNLPGINLKIENVPYSQECSFELSFHYQGLDLTRIRITDSRFYDLNHFWPVFNKNLNSILCF